MGDSRTSKGNELSPASRPDNSQNNKVKRSRIAKLFGCASKNPDNDDKTAYGTAALHRTTNETHNFPTISVLTAPETRQEQSADDECPICKCSVTNPKQLGCGHEFCSTCIDRSLKECQPKCPVCGFICGTQKGNQPPGTMSTRTLQQSLAGYELYDTIQIQYTIPSGIQSSSHPNPGQHFEGTVRQAFLPNNAEGNEVCRLLRQAFDAGLIFTVGQSVTSGRDNTVVWNDIHHKTKFDGSYGYPDPTYLTRVREELRAKGIVSYSAQQQSADVHQTRQPKKHSKPRPTNPQKMAASQTFPAYSNTTVTSRHDRNPKETKSRKRPLKEAINVDEYVWKYIEKFHRSDLQRCCGTNVKYTYSRETVPYKLIIESTNGQPVTNACEEVASLCQKIVPTITNETFRCPQRVSHQAVSNLGRSLTEQQQQRVLFYVDNEGICHVVGPKDVAPWIKAQILTNLTEDRRAMVLWTGNDDFSESQRQSRAGVSASSGHRRKRSRSYERPPAKKAYEENQELTRRHSHKSITASTQGRLQFRKSLPQTFQTMTSCGIHVKVYRGDIVQEKSDAIVNPANVFLSHGGGAAKAIADAAGPRLLRESREYIKKHGPLQVTQVTHTTAGRMNPPVQFVIHAAGPQADQFPDRNQLYASACDTFRHCLLYANNFLQISSISIPAISSGIFGVPKEMVASAAHEALVRLESQIRHGTQRYLQTVNFVNVDAETTEVFVETFQRKFGDQLQYQGRDSDPREGASPREFQNAGPKHHTGNKAAARSSLSQTRSPNGHETQL